MEGQQYFRGKNKEIPAAELWAIAEALEIARKETLNNHITPITILSDPREALTVSGSQSLTQKVHEPWISKKISKTKTTLLLFGGFLVIKDCWDMKKPARAQRKELVEEKG